MDRRKTPPEKLRKIRDMLRSGFSASEIKKSTRVSFATIRGQALLLERFEGFDPNGLWRDVNAIRATSTDMRARSHAARGVEHDADSIDLVSLFATPRTTRQLRRFMGVDDG